MIEKNFKYNMIYQLLSPVTFRDSPAHPVSFISKHGYDWLNADKQLEFWKYFSAQLESIVYLYFIKIVPFPLRNIRFFNTKHPVIILRASLFVFTPSHVASWKIECQNFSYVYRSRKHCECKYYCVIIV